ncbi:MAG TPA: DUF58 domain-containing protein [Candidatus Kapabacteria bacterium]|jgi:uncharacterized protein (DUF58 family)|nr:DUF58 domain-containing protein [Candidatus Kapabacteria bacterium]
MVRRRLTPLGKLFLGLLFLFYVASVTSQSGLLLLLIGLFGGCYVITWWFSTRSVKYLRVTPPQEVYLVEGCTPTQPWRFENLATKHAEMVEVLHEGKMLFRIPVVKTKEWVSLIPAIVYEKRGVFPNARVTLTCAAPYGLIRATRQLQIPGEVVVFPKVYGIDSPVSLGIDMISGGRLRGGRQVNSGTHFAGVRGWQSGDSIKQVHWKSTARRGDMMVKTFEEELGGRLSVILDCCRTDEAMIDNAIRAAASLSVATLQEGHHLEFIDVTDQPVIRLSPFNDESELLERLARHTPPVKSLEVDVQSLWRRSTVALVGTRWNDWWDNFIGHARAQRRSIHVYLPVGTRIAPSLDAEIHYFAENEIVEQPEQFAR